MSVLSCAFEGYVIVPSQRSSRKPSSPRPDESEECAHEHAECLNVPSVALLHRQRSVHAVEDGVHSSERHIVIILQLVDAL